MVKLQNVSPFGDLDVPVLGRVISAGEVFDVPVNLAEGFADQPSNWAAVVDKGEKE